MNNLKDFSSSDCLLELKTDKPTIYFVTPTYFRHVQQAELTRLLHTLVLAGNIHWILVEDSDQRSQLVTELLNKSSHQFKLKSTHLYTPTPISFKTSSSDPSWLKPKGVWQRNEALRWLREQAYSLDLSGTLYFGDDDNTYDLELFDEIRRTRRVSVFPVGLVGGQLVERPLVDKGKVWGFNAKFKPNRKYPIDMAGFAVSLKLLHEKGHKARFDPLVPRGHQETHFLEQLIRGRDELEPMADSCRKILVWHTRTQLPKLNRENLQRT